MSWFKRKLLRNRKRRPKNTEINDNWFEKSVNENQIKSYKYSDFKIFQSTSGIVCANIENTDNIYALRSFNDDEETTYKIFCELSLHQTAGVHENLLRFHGITKIETAIDIERMNIKKFCLVLEYAESGTLNTYLKNNKLDWNDKLNLALQLASAISHLHKNGIIHRDLHADNILVHQKNIKLDLFATKGSNNSDNTFELFSILPYIDPKSFIVENYELNKRSNVYSIGMLLWQISSGCQPFHAEAYNASLVLAIMHGQREKVVDGTPDEYSKLYTECWNHDPDKRPDIDQIVSILNQLISSYATIPSIVESLEEDNQEETATKWIKDNLENGIVKFIPFNELKHPESLCEGGFGSIVKVIWTKTNSHVVYKKLNNTVEYHKLDAFINELKIHLHLCCSDRIVRCLGISQDEMAKEYLLVMQYADGGNLRDYLKSHFENLTWNDKKKLAFQIADGINYLHNENVLHKDLHANNIVIHEKNAKITDFGAAKFQNQKTQLHMVNCGIVVYMEPKRIFNPEFKYTKASDIYSFGVLMWEISSGYPPFKNSIGKSDKIALAYAINDGLRENEIPGTPDDYKSLYKNCWNQEPEQRPTIGKILDEFEGIGFDVKTKHKVIEAPDLHDDLPDI